MKAKVKRLEENRTKMFGKFIRAFMNSRRAIKLALNEKKKKKCAGIVVTDTTSELSRWEVLYPNL